MNLLQTIILSVLEGITEFLPISSTGHLILASNILKIEQTEFVKSFEIIIQLAAILAVVVIYFKKLVLDYNFKLYKNIMISFLPSVIFGLFFYDFIKKYLIGNSLVVTISLLIGGIVMIVFEKFVETKQKQNLETLDYLKIGIFQVLSMIPGVSRAFATIFGGMIAGMDRKKATEFSFLLAVPTMIAETGLDLVKTDLSSWASNEYKLLAVGFIGSFTIAYIVIRWLIKYVQTHDFTVFGWYRIAVAFLYFLYIL